MNMVSPLVCHPMGGRHPITAQETPPRGSDEGVIPCGRAHCARHTDASVHSLDGYTCQGTPSLMDGPQLKAANGAAQSNGATPRGSCRSCRSTEPCRSCRTHCRSWTVGAVGGGYDSSHAWSLSDSCRSCQTVGLSDAVGLSDICRTLLSDCRTGAQV